MWNKLHISVLVAAAVVVWGATLFIQGTPITIDHLAPFSIVVGFLGSAGAGFEYFLWRQRWLQGWFVKRPDVRGTWRVKLQSNWVNPSTQKQIDPIDCFMTVTQTYSNLQMHLMTPESNSWFVADRIRASQKSEGYEIIGVYTNQPRINLRGDRSQIHFGAVVLNTHGANHFYPDILTGEYWTERGTKGNLILSKRVTKIYSRYEDAKHPKIVRPGRK